MTVRTVDGCIKCGACLQACPVLRHEGRAAFPGPRRLVVEAPRYGPGIGTLDGPLALCTTCGRCQQVCPSALPLPDALVRVRSMAPARRSPGLTRMAENIDRTGRTVQGGPASDRPSRGDLAFFPGCISEARLPEAVSASLALLRASGARPYIPGGWACCGSPLEKVGDTERSEKVRAINSEWLEEVSTVVASCPGCVVQLQRAYGKDALHVLEYVHSRGNLSSSMFEPHAPALRVALHRPCHLSRVVGPHTMEMARELLALVPGVTVVEHDGEDECCGGGGGVASSRPEVAARMAARKVAAARRSGADLLLAPCPFCVTNLGRVGGIAVQELVAFVAGRLRPRQ